MILRKKLIRSYGDPGYTITLETSAASFNRTITMPSTIQSGDLAVLAAFGYRSGTSALNTISLSSGFTQRGTDVCPGTSNGRVLYVLATKILDGTEGGDTLYGLANDSGDYYTAILIFRQIGGFTSLSVGTEYEDSGDDTGQSISYPASTIDLPFICVIAATQDYMGYLDYTTTLSATGLTSVFNQTGGEIVLRVCLQQLPLESSISISTDTEITIENFLNIATLLPE